MNRGRAASLYFSHKGEWIGSLVSSLVVIA